MHVKDRIIKTINTKARRDNRRVIMRKESIISTETFTKGSSHNQSFKKTTNNFFVANSEMSQAFKQSAKIKRKLHQMRKHTTTANERGALSVLEWGDETLFDVEISEVMT